ADQQHPCEAAPAAGGAPRGVMQRLFHAPLSSLGQLGAGSSSRSCLGASPPCAWPFEDGGTPAERRRARRHAAARSSVVGTRTERISSAPITPVWAFWSMFARPRPLRRLTTMSTASATPIIVPE